MIQPVSALTPRAGFRGSNGTSMKAAKSASSSRVALINAGGVATVAGGLTAIVARGYTASWGHAAVLGACGAFLSMFFMTPHLIEKTGLGKSNKKNEAELLMKEDTPKLVDAVKEHLRPAKKLVQFRQQS